MIRRYIWSVIAWLYAHAAKPLLFLTKPDDIHNAMLRFSVFMGNHSLTRNFVALVFKKRPGKSLEQEIGGITFANPVGLSAGFDKNGEIVPTIASLGFGFETVGSTTAKPCAGNPHPWFHRLPKTMSVVVNAGLANEGSRAIISRLHNLTEKKIHHFPIVLSVAKTNNRKVVDTDVAVADYVASVRRAKSEKNISAIELNISCPNTFGGEPFTTPRRLNKLLKAVDDVEIGKPIFVKMPVDLEWKDFSRLLDVVVKYNVTGVTIANLFKDRSKIDIKDPLPNTIAGNLSGRPTFNKSNQLIRQTYLNYGDKLTIIGVGGIFSAEEAYTKIRLGASLVEIISGVLFVGPQLAAQISDGLTRLLDKDGYSSIREAIGVDAAIEK